MPKAASRPSSLRRLPPQACVFWRKLPRPHSISHHSQCPFILRIEENQISSLGGAPLQNGAFSDVYKARIGNRLVALKYLRVFQTNIQHVKLKYQTEVTVLHHLNGHENIVPFVGILNGSLRPCIVLEWMDGGNIVQYLASHPEESKENLIKQVASGLLYLKERSVVHGDIKPDNILVTEHGLVRISDFGSAFFCFTGSRIRSSSLVPLPIGGTDRYLAPELLCEGSRTPTYQSDVFSFGMTVFQIFTGAVPFSEIKHATYASVLIVQGVRPQRSEDIPDSIWALVSTCWSQCPSDRPTIQQIHKNFRAV